MNHLTKLEAIWKVKHSELFEEIFQHCKEWNEAKLCSCMDSECLDGEFIVCKHLQKDRTKKFGPRIKKQFRAALVISSAELNNALNHRLD